METQQAQPILQEEEPVRAGAERRGRDARWRVRRADRGESDGAGVGAEASGAVAGGVGSRGCLLADGRAAG